MRSDPTDEINDFALKLRDEIRDSKHKRYSVFADMPPNRRPMYESVVREFEKAGRTWHSPSGTTMQIVMAWCKFKGLGFILEYDPKLLVFVLFATKEENREPV